MIGVATIERHAADHADTPEEPVRWITMARHLPWRDLKDVPQRFPVADQYKSLLVFNIRHNRYRLIVKIDCRVEFLMKCSPA